MKKLSAFLACLMVATPAAEASPAKKMWSAFVCSRYASLARIGFDEQQRLLDLGVKSGREHVAAAFAGKYDSDAPLYAIINPHQTIKYPSHDFIIGEIYAKSLDCVLDEMSLETEDDKTPLDADWWQKQSEKEEKWAGNKFDIANCGLLR